MCFIGVATVPETLLQVMLELMLFALSASKNEMINCGKAIPQIFCLIACVLRTDKRLLCVWEYNYVVLANTRLPPI